MSYFDYYEQYAGVPYIEHQAGPPPSPDEIAEGQYANEAFYPKEGERYHIKIKILKADCVTWGEVSCTGIIGILADTGADLTLLTRATAVELGYDLDLISDNFGVQGISGTPTEFKQIQTFIQLGQMRPLKVPVGFAYDEHGLFENLLGSKGILDTGLIRATYDNKGITYEVPRVVALASGSFL